MGELAQNGFRTEYQAEMEAAKRMCAVLAEEAEMRMRHHAESHGNSRAAFVFLTRHPEFDEFVRLVRAGSIQF